MSERRKMRRVRVRQLEGRIIESAIIWPPDDRDGVSLELRVSGGGVFNFTALVEPSAARAHSTWGVVRKNGDLALDIDRTFPHGPDDSEES